MYKNFIKRIFDVVLCLIGLPIFCVFFIIFGSLIYFEDKGPVFYKSRRIGKNREMYLMYKFRSMKVQAKTIINKDGSTFSSDNDKRLTKIGKILRKTSIDESAQIINVLKGNMSIIGPRASLPEALDSYKEDEMDKMSVLPGITGFSQAYFRNSISVREKRLKDAWYANHISFILDVKIFVRTVRTVVKKESLYTNESVKKLEV